MVDLGARATPGWKCSAKEGIRLKSAFYSTLPITSNVMSEPRVYKTYMCLICGFIYDEAAGLPEEGIPAGTKWEDVPVNWVCPECGARKEDFELIDV
jgi:rubredoxin